MKENIWIINHYAGDTFFDKGGRHYWFAKYLRKKNYKPVVFCCNNKHNPGTEEWLESNRLWEERVADEIDVPYVFVRARRYVGNGIKRILNMFDFYRNIKIVTEEYAKKHSAPDVIIASSVHPLTLIAGIQIAKKYRVKCICEIRDLWPETLVACGLLNRKNPMTLLLRYLEKWAYKNADRLIFTMEGAYDYIYEQKWQKDIPKSKVKYINNGIDLSEFNYNKNKYQANFDELDDKSLFKVVYTGSIRSVNNVGGILDVAKLLSDKNKKIVFLIFGSGNQLEMLINRVNEEHIKNVLFMGKVEKKYIPYIVSCADLNIMHCGESHIFKYGISFNKLFDYLAAGKPILTDFACRHNPVENGCAGISVYSGNMREIADAIEKISTVSRDEYKTYCDNALKAVKKYDFESLTNDLEDVICECLAKR